MGCRQRRRWTGYGPSYTEWMRGESHWLSPLLVLTPRCLPVTLGATRHTGNCLRVSIWPLGPIFDTPPRAGAPKLWWLVRRARLCHSALRHRTSWPSSRCTDARTSPGPAAGALPRRAFAVDCTCSEGPLRWGVRAVVLLCPLLAHIVCKATVTGALSRPTAVRSPHA